MEKDLQMNQPVKISDRVYALCTPYKDIFTTVYFVKTARGVLLFDAASYDCDVDNAIIPALGELGVGESDLKYVFISHNHGDHAGGLARLLASYPNVCVVSRSEALREKYPSHTFLSPEEGEVLLDELSVVFITGHTKDSAALYDMKTKMLISGDCLQLYGIFGSGNWGANISFSKEYIEKVQKLHEMDIETLLTAHDYHPYGRMHFGKAAVAAALDACLAPFALIQKLIDENPDADDATVCAMYNAEGKLPRLGVHVVEKYRAAKYGSV